MAQGRSLYWFSPASMFGGLLGGIVFAIGHHLFYHNLNGQIVSDGAFLNTPISEQQANIAIGTAFAFLVNSCLVFATTVAFIQVFWTLAHKQKSTNQPTLGKLNAGYSATRNPLALFNVFLWWTFPLLLSVATVTWLLPIGSIITPATLSVRSAPDVRTALLDVPDLNFRSLAFTATMTPQSKVNQQNVIEYYIYYYKGPSSVVQSIVDAVMPQGQLLPVSFHSSNASWTIHFHGPSLRCQYLSGNYLNLLVNDINNEVASHTTEYLYLSWFGKHNESRRASNASTNPYGPGWFTSKGSLAPQNNVDMAFYVTIPPINWAFTNYRLALDFDSVIRCQLVNSTYEHSVHILNGLQQTSTKVEYLNADTALKSIHSFKIPCDAADGNCPYNPQFFQTLSYQAVMDAFAQRVVGPLPWILDAPELDQSTVLNTILAQTQALKNISNYLSNSGSIPSLLPDKPEFQGLSNEVDNVITLDLPGAIEQLFRNVTLSMMFSSALRPNVSSITAPGPVNVTLITYHNEYFYAAWKLWIPYGIAIAVTAITTFGGIVIMIRCNAAYSDSFATIFRAARGANTSEDIQNSDRDGRDPLPRYLARMEVWFPEATEFASQNVVAAHQKPVVADGASQAEAMPSVDLALSSPRPSTDSRLLESYGLSG